jgi:flagellar basal-body rod modification protein FlgD
MIEPVATAGSTAREIVAPGGKMGKEEFLQLLVTQLRNQDPMNPSDPKDFAAQLAQFSTVEQLLNIGDQLEAMQSRDEMLIRTINATSALQLIGKSIVTEGNTVDMPANGEMSVRVNASGTGGSGTLVLRDEAGAEVARIALPRVDGGEQNIDLTNLVGQVPQGRYTYSVELTDSAGTPVPVTTFCRMRVDGVKYTTSGPVLSSGGITVALGQVIEILD